MLNPGSKEYENLVNFMRADLDSGMFYSKMIDAARKIIEGQGKNFDEEFKKWNESKKGGE